MKNLSISTESTHDNPATQEASPTQEPPPTQELPASSKPLATPTEQAVTNTDLILQGLVDAWRHHPMGAQGPASRGQRSRESYRRSDGLTEALRGVLLQIPPGTRLPGERPLAEALEVSRTTLRNAVETLAREGYVRVQPGRGTRSARPTSMPPTYGLRTFAEEMRLRHRTPSVRLIRHEVVKATNLLARELRLERGEEILYLQRLHSADSAPVAVEEMYVALRRTPGLLEGPPSARIEKHLDERCGVSLNRSLEQIEAVTATLMQERMLNLSSGAALLQIVRHQFAGDEVMVFSGTFYRPEAFPIRLDLRRL